MKKITKVITVSVLLLMTLLLAASCSKGTFYEEYDKDGYTVSVKYDANGGIFDTNTTVIVDSYNISGLPTNGNGNKEIALIKPSDPVRGSANDFHATRAGYFFAGWYASKEPVKDEFGNQLDVNGNIIVKDENNANAEGGEKNEQIPAYKYSNKWDFANGRYEVDPNKHYTSSEPVLTLYAVWIPEFKFEFYSINDPDTLISTYSISPLNAGEDVGSAFLNGYINLPYWDETTGKISMGNVPGVSGKTFDGLYLDKEGKNPVAGDKLTHSGSYDAELLTVSDSVVKLYVDYKDGEWFKIYTAQQLINCWKATGSYEIMADLDFGTGVEWDSSITHGNFTGTILGNGHKILNISVEQSDSGKNNTGIFGSLRPTAVIKDLKFENVTVKVAVGARVPDASFGLLAGTIDSNAKLENISVVNGKLIINANAIGLSDSSFGLVCGSGTVESLENFDISCEIDGEGLEFTVSGNEIVLSAKAE